MEGSSGVRLEDFPASRFARHLQGRDVHGYHVVTLPVYLSVYESHFTWLTFYISTFLSSFRLYKVLSLGLFLIPALCYEPLFFFLFNVSKCFILFIIIFTLN